MQICTFFFSLHLYFSVTIDRNNSSSVLFCRFSWPSICASNEFFNVNLRNRLIILFPLQYWSTYVEKIMQTLFRRVTVYGESDPRFPKLKGRMS